MINFQRMVTAWMLACFGKEISEDKQERNHRFLEEALELVQACGMTSDEAHELVEYTFNRPIGHVPQEVGGVMVTLAALCAAQVVNLETASRLELDRIWRKIYVIREKQRNKPRNSPLPEFTDDLTGCADDQQWSQEELDEMRKWLKESDGNATASTD